jgi:predicted metal-dependent phosphotriesterase family hydrolase
MCVLCDHSAGPPIGRRTLLKRSGAVIAAAGVSALLPMPTFAEQATGTPVVGSSTPKAAVPTGQGPILETVTGPVTADQIAKASAHEHLYVDFHGPNDPNYMNVDWSDVIGACENSVNVLRSQDVNLLIEWTNIGVGRNVMLLRHVARKTGMNIVCPTGIYKSLIPPAFGDMGIEQMADVFVKELTKGIDGSPIRAGFIKIASTEKGATETDTKIHRAAAIAAKETGATIALHSPFAATTNAVTQVLTREGFRLERFVWGHAQPSSMDDHKAMAARGATMQFDAISARSDPFFHGPTDDESMLDRIENLVKAGHGDQVLVSTDASVFVNPPKWQYDRDNSYLHRYFEDKLKQRLGEAAAGKVLRDNVISAFRRGDNIT